MAAVAESNSSAMLPSAEKASIPRVSFSGMREKREGLSFLIACFGVKSKCKPKTYKVGAKIMDLYVDTTVYVTEQNQCGPSEPVTKMCPPSSKLRR